MADRVVTPEFRVSYPWIFRPQTNQRRPDADPKYSVVCLFAADANLAPLKKLVADTLNAKFGVKESWPKNLRSPFRDQGEKESIGYESGCVFITASSKQRPGIVDKNGNPIIEESDFYAGCYAVAQVHTYYYDVDGNRGVSFGLDHVMKRRDGEPLDGRMKATEAFKEFIGSDDGDSAEGDDDPFKI